MEPLLVINRYYRPGSRRYQILVAHSQAVAEKALRIATDHPEWGLDLSFIREAAMLHDIGIFMTIAAKIGCNGKQPYVTHGILGRALLESQGLQAHGMVCERHVGVGLTANEIKSQQLPLPLREMVPVSMAEKIVCYADKFFSKNGDTIEREKSFHEVMATIERYGSGPVERFRSWARLFGDL